MKYRVNLVESERGWGRKIDDVRYFDTRAEADEFVVNFNADLEPRDASGRAPDWYYQAEGPYEA